MDLTDDHSVDKQLAGCLHSNSCGQQLDIQGETSDNWSSLGVNTETSILVGDMDSGMENTLSKSAHYTKLCGGTDVLEGRDSIHRNLYVPEKWAHESQQGQERGPAPGLG